MTFDYNVGVSVGSFVGETVGLVLGGDVVGSNVGINVGILVGCTVSPILLASKDAMVSSLATVQSLMDIVAWYTSMSETAAK